jgi:hypothetical protein
MGYFAEACEPGRHVSAKRLYNKLIMLYDWRIQDTGRIWGLYVQQMTLLFIVALKHWTSKELQ